MPARPAKPSFNPAWILLLGVGAVSSGAVFVRLAEAGPLAKAAWRMTLATVLVLPLGLRAWPAASAGFTRRTGMIGLGAGFFLALHFGTWISSLDFTSVANSVTLVNTTPVWVALLAPWLSRDQVSRRDWLGILLSFGGAVIISRDTTGGAASSLLGDSLALGGGLALAFYLSLGRLVRAQLPLPCYLTLCYGSASLCLWAAVLISGQPFTGFNWKTWGALAGMAVISQHLGHSSYNWAMKHFSASVVAMCLLGEPVLGSWLAWWLFGEALSIGKVTGGLLILAGIYLTASKANAAPTPSPSK